MKRIIVPLVAALVMIMASIALDTGLAVPQTSPYLTDATLDVAIATGAPPPVLTANISEENKTATTIRTEDLYCANANLDGGPAPNCPVSAWNNNESLYDVTISTSPGVSAATCQRLKMPYNAATYSSDVNLESTANSWVYGGDARLGDGTTTRGIAGTRLRLPSITRCATDIRARA